jgi:hypothetical protein
MSFLKSTLKFFCLTAILLMLGGVAKAQVTTSSISGIVKDTKGEVLVGATLLAVHTPSGTTYGTVTNEDGRFNVTNMRIGGPYKVTVSYVGYKTFEMNVAALKLGEPAKFNLTLAEDAMALDAVEVVYQKNDLLGNDKTGAGTIVNNGTINALPTIARDLTDFTRLTPQATVTSNGGISIAGMNNRFNSIFIDGAVNNDVFGLSESGTNGGQTGVSPISIDAIEELQVVVAPFDVRQGGFAGGGINAVTRSGTNNIEGSVYGFYRNQNLAGKTPFNYPSSFRNAQKDSLDKTGKRLVDFDTYTAGFRVGGPIKKDKIFYFINGEFQNEATPIPGVNFGTYTGTLKESNILALVDTLRTKYGYNPGAYNGSTRNTKGLKLLGKLDFNLNKNNRLTVRHSFAQSETTILSSNSNANINFSNSGYIIPNTTNSSAAELNTIFNEKMSNNLIVGFTSVVDDRDAIGQDFPRVIIRDGGARINFGTEAFSTANLLKQRILTLTDNFTLYKGKHTITLGTHNEFYNMYNLFIRQNYGQYEYDSLSLFLTNKKPRQFDRSYSLLEGDITGDGARAAADFNALQLGLYAQDEFNISKRLTLTLGVRADLPMFLTQPGEDREYNNKHKATVAAAWVGTDIADAINDATVGKMPTPKVLLAPRFGFNWDVLGNQNLKLRGGAGIFTSRLPFVWAGSAYTNNGVTIGGVQLTTPPNDFRFNANPFNQPTATSLGLSQAIPSGELNIFDRNFKYPQVVRANLAADFKLPYGIVATVEGMYSKMLNTINYYNINFKPGALDTLNGPDRRLIYSNSRIVSNYGNNIYFSTNTNKGHSYNITTQLQKAFKNGLFLNASYTYGDSWVINEGTSSQVSSQWRTMETRSNLNNIELSRSDFSIGHRIVGAASYKFDYFKHFATSISVFYNGQSGTPFSYTISGNLGGQEGSNSVYLMYIPTNEDIEKMTFAASGGAIETQRANFKAFIEADDYLSKNRGQYAERNASRTPFINIFDVRLTQDFYTTDKKGRRHNLQFTFDVFNFGNMLNTRWGRRYFLSFDQYNILNFTGYKDAKTGDYTPIYTFRKPNTQIFNPDDQGVNSSRWQGQVGLRYSF